MQREYEVSTRFGTFYLTPTDGQHIHATSGRSGYGDRNEYAKVNGVDIHVSAHLYLQPGGSWAIGRDEDGHNRHHQLYATRARWVRAADMDASHSARAKISAELADVVTAWVAAHPDVMRAAQDADHTGKVAAARRDVEKARDALEAAEEVLAGLLQAASEGLMSVTR